MYKVNRLFYVASFRVNVKERVNNKIMLIVTNLVKPLFKKKIAICDTYIYIRI